MRFIDWIYFIFAAIVFLTRKYVFIGKKHVIHHDIIQEITLNHTVKSFRHIETFLLRKKAF